jgi:hypothetical protein
MTTEAVKAWKRKIETVDLWKWVVLESAERDTTIYKAHVTHKAGNLYFQSRVHRKLMPYAVCFANTLDLDDIPIVIRRGGPLDRDFSRELGLTLEGGAIVSGNLACIYNPRDLKEERPDLPWTIVYSHRLRWTDSQLATLDGQEVAMPAIISVIAHELHHIKHPNETEHAIVQMTSSFLAELAQ